MKFWTRLAIVAAVLAAVGYAYWKFAIPTHRVEVRSELVMLGDLDGDHKWTAAELAILQGFLSEPFAAPDDLACHLDLNRNGLIDEKDLPFLRALVAAGGDPYAAEDAARAKATAFPRPRELYRYQPLTEYRPRPLSPFPTPLTRIWARTASHRLGR